MLSKENDFKKSLLRLKKKFEGEILQWYFSCLLSLFMNTKKNVIEVYAKTIVALIKKMAGNKYQMFHRYDEQCIFYICRFTLLVLLRERTK